MPAEDPAIGLLTDVALRNEIHLLEIGIAACEAQIEPDSEEAKRSRRIARGTFLTAAGFFGFSLDPISAIVAVVGVFDWIEGIRDDASAYNLRLKLRRRRIELRGRYAALQAEVRRRGGKI
jgi:hypothetical protein